MNKKIGIAIIFLAGAFLLSGCGEGQEQLPKTFAEEKLNTNGIRNDIQQYIDGVYSNSVKRKTALIGYAKAIQFAYLNARNKKEAESAEKGIIRARKCINMVGEISGENSPSKIVEQMTSDTPERLRKQFQYEKFVEGKDITAFLPDEKIQDICGFNPNSLPN